MKLQIDIVIPSFRLEESFVLPLLSLSIPENTSVHFFLIADNPSADISPGIRSAIGQENISFLVNAENLGAGQSRNEGINMGSGDWILLLDDDVIPSNDLLHVYAAAIRSAPDESGFIGLILLPEPTTTISRAIVASGSMDIFSVAAKKKSYAWGATANIMVRRSAIGDIRFLPAYPKSGGGEDVDFFLRVREKNLDRNFICLPAATVTHPWWNTRLNPLRRPFRYGKGNALLARFNPRYAYYDWLDTPETIGLILLASLAAAVADPVMLGVLARFLAGIILIEFFASGIQTWKRSHRIQPGVIWFVTWLRLAEQSGVMWERASKGKWTEIGRRFHDDGRTDKIAFYRSNTYRIVKWILYPLLAIFLLRKNG